MHPCFVWCAEELGEDDESDSDDEPAKPDAEDGWMLELSEKQLLKLLAQVNHFSVCCVQIKAAAQPASSGGPPN